MTDLFGGQIQSMVADFNTGVPLPRDRNPALLDLPALSKTVVPRWIRPDKRNQRPTAALCLLNQPPDTPSMSGQFPRLRPWPHLPMCRFTADVPEGRARGVG
jgi:hypothetical protein